VSDICQQLDCDVQNVVLIQWKKPKTKNTAATLVVRLSILLPLTLGHSILKDISCS